MPNSQPPLYDLSFWWLRHLIGIALPIVLTIWGIYSMVTRHSYAVWWWRSRWIHFVPVKGEQAVLMGLAYLGLALVLFANCYAQYHNKMGFYYERLLIPGIILAGGGVLWCGLLFLP